MRQFGQELVDGPAPQTLLNYIIIYSTIGLFAGLIFGTIDILSNRWTPKFRSFGQVILINSIVYLITFFILTVVGISVFTLFDQNEISWSLISGFLFSKEMLLLLVYCSAISFLIHFVKQVNRNFGSKNLWRMLTGKFHTPKEVERIVMFLDLKASTTIAERIGHIAYSNLIQDCFKDLSIIKKYKAEVYQYVGDEVVLIWEKEAGLRNENFIKAFFEFKHKLKERTHYYQDQYQVIPTFKGGCNLGKVVMAEVGQLKREIAYHGDTVNTASRIQDKCNEYDKDFLISEFLYDTIEDKKNFKFDFIDQLILKGKTKGVKIYSITTD